MINKQAIIFDVDGTLVESWTTRLLPGRYKRLGDLREAGKQLYMATNQAGPAYHLLEGLRRGRKIKKYPDLIIKVTMLEDIRIQIGAYCCYVALHPGNLTVEILLKEKLEIPDKEVFSYCDNRIKTCWLQSWRKPAAGMLEAIISDGNFSREQCIYIGNNNMDSHAATKAGISYMDTEEFFNTNEPTRYP